MGRRDENIQPGRAPEARRSDDGNLKFIGGRDNTTGKPLKAGYGAAQFRDHFVDDLGPVAYLAAFGGTGALWDTRGYRSACVANANPGKMATTATPVCAWRCGEVGHGGIDADDQVN